MVTIILRSLVLTGRKQNIVNWDLKILSGMCLTMRLEAELLRIPVVDFECNSKTIEVRIKQFRRSDQDQDISQDLVKWCLRIKGKEHFLFTPFRVKLQKLFHGNSSQVIHILNGLNFRFYGEMMDKELEKKIYHKTISPLTVVLRFIIDGHLLDKTNLDYIDYLVQPFIGRKPNIENVVIGAITHKKEGVFLRRGECLIINQIFEDDPTSRRDGTKKDEMDLVELFEYLGCKNNVLVERDLTSEEMMTVLKNFRYKLRISKPDFFVLVILSHGKRNPRTGTEYILDIKKRGVPLRKITNMFIDGQKCPSMVGKPKLFFVQACRGEIQQLSLRYFIQC